MCLPASQVIMPDSRLRVVWTILTVFFMAYVSTIFTFNVCFQDSVSPFWETFDHIMNYFFMTDIFLNFFTAYYDVTDNTLVVNNKFIAINYFKGWFFFDLFAV